MKCLFSPLLENRENVHYLPLALIKIDSFPKHLSPYPIWNFFEAYLPLPS
jgi:hypothetical protein